MAVSDQSEPDARDEKNGLDEGRNGHEETDGEHGVPGHAPKSPSSGDGVRLEKEQGAEKVEAEKEEEVKKEPSRFKKLIDRAGLDVPTVLMMFKNSLPPTIGVAFYQATSVAETYTTLGYLVPIISVLSVAIMPRAKYLQTMILNIIGICIGSAVALLGIWSGVQARKHTTPVGSTATYNSSQAAVCAIWLFANIWFVNTLRAKVPAVQFPVIMYSIFTNVAFTYGPRFPTIASGEALIEQLLKGFLTAFAIATGVSLFIIPVSSRKVVFKEQAGYLGLLQKTLGAQSAYLQSLETSDMFAVKEETARCDGEGGRSKKRKKAKEKAAHPARNSQAAALKECVAALVALHGKLHGDLEFGKREFAWGKLDPEDLEEIFTLLRQILIPVVGMTTIIDIFERIAERRGWVEVSGSKFDRAESWEQSQPQDKEEEKRTWNEVMKALHDPFVVCIAAMDEGLQHAGLVLELIAKPKKKKGQDVEEADGDNPKPGDPNFSEYLEAKVKAFYATRGETLKTWARKKGLTEADFDSAKLPDELKDCTPAEAKHRRDQQQLYLILFLENLLFASGMAISNLVRFADKKVAEGCKNHFIFPGKRRLWKWVKSLGQEDVSIDNESPDSLEAGVNTVYLGSGFTPKDPEHLPPETWWQHFGNGLRSISHFLGSAESAFGFRVACATLSVGIIAFLKDTQTFFMEQRLVWAMIIIAIGMSLTAGQSMFGFFGRVAGTFVAMVCSYVIWYIVDQKTAGVIVMLWFFIFVQMYFFIKFPRFLPVFLVSIVTEVLIIGYELQVRKIGIAAASASGQPYYPTYLLAPYRLATVAAGSFVAFIWTIFPSPISDRSWLRQDLGSTLHLLANYYSVVHSTIGARIHDTEGDMELKSSPGRRLEKERHKIFGKLLLMLPSLKQHADWQKWEISIGGKFPRETYDAIIIRAENIMHYLSLMSYATEPWSNKSRLYLPDAVSITDNCASSSHASTRQWLHDLSLLIDAINPTSHGITSVLSLLSASVRQGSPLPPYIQLPAAYNLSHKLEKLDRGILSARHVEEQGYSAYATLQVCSSLVTDDLRRLVEHVKDLVGETDFSFRVDGGKSADGSSVDTVVGSAGGDGSGSQREVKKGKRD